MALQRPSLPQHVTWFRPMMRSNRENAGGLTIEDPDSNSDNIIGS